MEDGASSPSDTGSEHETGVDSDLADQTETQDKINTRLKEAKRSEDDDNNEDLVLTTTGADFFSFSTSSSLTRHRAIDPEPSHNFLVDGAGQPAAAGRSAGEPNGPRAAVESNVPVVMTAAAAAR